MNYASKLGIAGVAGLMAAFPPIAGASVNTAHVCHSTGAAANPTIVIAVSENAVPALLSQGDHLAFNLGKFPNDVWFCGSG